MKHFVLLAGGLGNQLFQYAAAIEAGATEVVFLDLTSNKRVNSSNMPDIFDLNVPIPMSYMKPKKRTRLARYYFFWLLGSTSDPNKLRFKVAKSKLVLKATSFLVRNVTKGSIDVVLDDRRGGNFQGSLFSGSILLVGYFQDFDNCKKFVRMLKDVDLFEISNEVNEYSLNLGGKTSVGVHIRRGDYENQTTFGLLSDAYFRHALTLYADEVSTVNFFSDSPISPNAFLSMPFLENSKVCPSSFTATEVLCLMSNCYTLILSNSSLSWWAGVMVQSKGGRVISPYPWFRTEVYSPKLYLDGWLTERSLFKF